MKLNVLLLRTGFWMLCVIVSVNAPVTTALGKMAPVEEVSCKEQISRASAILDGVQISFEMPPPDKMLSDDKIVSPYPKIKNSEGKAEYKVEKIYKGIIPDRVEVVFPARQNSSLSSYRWRRPPTEGIIALNRRGGVFEILTFSYQCKEELLTLGKSQEELDIKISQHSNELTFYLDKIKLYEEYKDYANATRVYETALQIFPHLKSDEEFLKLSRTSKMAEICETRIRRMGDHFYGSRKKDELEAFRTACMNEDPPQ